MSSQAFCMCVLTYICICLCVSLPPVRLTQWSDATCHMDEHTRSPWQRSEESNFIMSSFHLAVKQMCGHTHPHRYTHQKITQKAGEAYRAARKNTYTYKNFISWFDTLHISCLYNLTLHVWSHGWVTVLSLCVWQRECKKESDSESVKEGCTDRLPAYHTPIHLHKSILSEHHSKPVVPSSPRCSSSSSSLTLSLLLSVSPWSKSNTL